MKDSLPFSVLDQEPWSNFASNVYESGFMVDKLEDRSTMNCGEQPSKATQGRRAFFGSMCRHKLCVLRSAAPPVKFLDKINNIIVPDTGLGTGNCDWPKNHCQQEED